MKKLLCVGLTVVALAISAGTAGEPLQSGIPVGGRTSAFHPWNVTGDAKDMKNCLV
jgi:hypothetical protein